MWETCGRPYIYIGMFCGSNVSYEATFPLHENQMLRLTILIQSPVAMLMPTHHILSGKVLQLELHCIHALEPTRELNMN